MSASLAHGLSFPVATLAKSAKMVPVMRPGSSEGAWRSLEAGIAAAGRSQIQCAAGGAGLCHCCRHRRSQHVFNMFSTCFQHMFSHDVFSSRLLS